MTDHHSAEEQDSFERGYHDIPDDGKIRAMSYIRLSEVFHSCEKDSIKFHVIEREVKRRIAKDHAEINRSNIFFGACVAGIFGLIGVLLGYYLRAEDVNNQVTPASAVQKIGNSNLIVKPPLENVAVGAQAVAPQVSQPARVTSNASTSNRHP